MNRIPIHHAIAPGAHQVEPRAGVQAVVVLAMGTRLPAHEQAVGSPVGHPGDERAGPAALDLAPRRGLEGRSSTVSLMEPDVRGDRRIIHIG